MRDIHELLENAIKERASDLVIKVGSPPVLRVDGRIVITDAEPFDLEEAREIVYSLIHSASRDFLLRFKTLELPKEEEATTRAEQQIKRLEEGEEIDLSFTVPDLVRVRANVYMQRESAGAAIRIIPLKPFSIEELGLPPVLKTLSEQPHGLILVTGPTGSGKSTTLAAMIDYINSTRQSNIVTIEDPIEYVFADKKSIIQQREVGKDTKSFATGLKSVLRQTPDVIMIGEIRDVDTMAVVLTAAEVGHLVLSTLHTTSAASTIERIINMFLPHQQNQARIQVSEVIQGVISQKLIPRADGKGRVAAVEVMTASPMVRKHIEEKHTGDLYSVIREGGHWGMNTLNQSLYALYQRGLITEKEAITNAGNVTELRQMLRRA